VVATYATKNFTQLGILEKYSFHFSSQIKHNRTYEKMHTCPDQRKQYEP